MKTKATIKVEFIAGDTIEDAFEESIRLAKLLNCWIEFNFNGVTCTSNRSGEIMRGVASYHKEIQSDKCSKVAFS